MDIPEPDPALVLIAVALRSYLKRLSRKERAAFLADIDRDLERLESFATVIRIRGSEHDKADADARKKAAAWWASARRVIEATL